MSRHRRSKLHHVAEIILFAVLFALGFAMTQPAQAPGVTRNPDRIEVTTP